MQLFKEAYRRFAAIGLLALAVAVSGCGDDKAREALKSGGDKVAQVAPRFEDLPGCDGIAAILGDMVADLIPTEENGDARFDDVTVYGVQCTWLTQHAASDNPFEQIKVGSFGIGITVNDVPQEEGPLRSMGMVYDDPRVKAIGGFVVDMGGKLDPAAQLGIVGPQVVVGRVTIMPVATGAFLQKPEGTRGITNDRAIEAAVALHKSLR